MGKHKIELRTQFYETDRGHLIHYSNYFRYFETAEVELLRSIGASYEEMWRRRIALPRKEAHCVYEKMAGYDEVLEVYASIEELSDESVKFCFEIFRKGDPRRVAHGYTICNCVSLDHGLKPCKFPEEIARALRAGVD